MEKEKKYKLTDEYITTIWGKKLYRIEALKDFGLVEKGYKGGFIESEDNLSQKDNCWISGNAKVYDNARVYDNVRVCGNAKIYDNARVYDNVRVYGNAKIYGNAEVCGNAEISGIAKIKSNSDYIVFKNWWSSGRHFTWTRSNNMWRVGYFFGTGAELIAKAYKDSELSGREYERIVKHVESILKEE